MGGSGLIQVAVLNTASTGHPRAAGVSSNTVAFSCLPYAAAMFTRMLMSKFCVRVHAPHLHRLCSPTCSTQHARGGAAHTPRPHTRHHPHPVQRQQPAHRAGELGGPPPPHAALKTEGAQQPRELLTERLDTCMCHRRRKGTGATATLNQNRDGQHLTSYDLKRVMMFYRCR